MTQDNILFAYLSLYENDSEKVVLNESEEINEISLKTKMSAYAKSQESDAGQKYGTKVYPQGARLRKAIVKKHGEKAGKAADDHAYAKNWGREDKSGNKKLSPEPKSSKRKMSPEDQQALKKRLRSKLGKGDNKSNYFD